MGTHYEGTDEEKTTLNAFIKLMRATESVNTRLNRHLADADITVSQFGVLEALLHLGPLNQKALGEKLLKSGGNITMVIDNLERCGYVERQRDPEDRRSVLIHLTEDGKKFIQDFFPKHLEAIKNEFSVLSRQEKEQLAEICKKLGLQGK
ncbi:MarR family transcriptional regulator [Aliifodinibius sp. S!AR15-10]|uniref:MarR family winged helix-turn-helix transcriptional regulator n=1 Tax=Aliifodinibius sp. S!AR15-10 TaxID=2950437 RepID=UPI00286433B4|nr:MarR family transcriptional regulator [Aliifodinibius sp. S!AR15-10]MDR8391309.1 MarR family transcriptional regulator [Aliifodinibius sp. S!AR15-10]